MNENVCAIVGDGRMASHFARYLEFEGIPFKRWSRKEDCDPAEKLAGCSPLLLLISDDAISPFGEEHPEIYEMNPIHFSGALYNKKIPGIHPLMSFTNELYDHQKYRSIPFIHEEGGQSITDLFPTLQNRTASVKTEKKGLYHCLCVMGGNFTTLLWQKMIEEMNNLGIDESLLIPYLEQTVENLKNDWQNALTGPLARKDKNTINKNISSLGGDPYRQVYEAFVETRRNK